MSIALNGQNIDTFVELLSGRSYASELAGAPGPAGGRRKEPRFTSRLKQCVIVGGQAERRPCSRRSEGKPRHQENGPPVTRSHVGQKTKCSFSLAFLFSPRTNRSISKWLASGVKMSVPSVMRWEIVGAANQRTSPSTSVWTRRCFPRLAAE